MLGCAAILLEEAVVALNINEDLAISLSHLLNTSLSLIRLLYITAFLLYIMLTCLLFPFLGGAGPEV